MGAQVGAEGRSARKLLSAPLELVGRAADEGRGREQRGGHQRDRDDSPAPWGQPREPLGAKPRACAGGAGHRAHRTHHALHAHASDCMHAKGFRTRTVLPITSWSFLMHHPTQGGVGSCSHPPAWAGELDLQQRSAPFWRSARLPSPRPAPRVATAACAPRTSGSLPAACPTRTSARSRARRSPARSLRTGSARFLPPAPPPLWCARSGRQTGSRASPTAGAAATGGSTTRPTTAQAL